MTSLLGPPELFSAWSCAIDGQDPNEPLPPGAHLRVFAGLSGTFPLAPLAVFKVPAVVPDHDMFALFFSDEQDHPVSREDLAQLGTADARPVFADDDNTRTVGVELFPADQTDFDAQLLSPHGRLMAERQASRFLFSAPTLSRFRLTGRDLEAMEYSRYVVQIEQALLHGEPAAAAQLGLPVQGTFPWYVGVHSRDDAFGRVSRGAPARLSVMDQPAGPFSSLVPEDEVRRVDSLLKSATFGDGLEGLAAAMVADALPAPWLQTGQQPFTGQNQVAVVPRLGCLQLAAIDPGIARFFGFADRIDDPSLTTLQPPAALAVVGVLAIDPDLAGQWPHLDTWLKQPNPAEADLIDLVGHTIQAPDGSDISDDLNDVVQRVRQGGFLVRAMVAVTLPAPPWLPPTPPAPTVLDHRWQASDGTTASSRYRATFAFAGAPLGALAAVARQQNSGWTSAHDSLPVSGGSVSSRRVPRMFGSESDPATRVQAQVGAQTPGLLEEAQLLAEQDVLAGDSAVPYRFWAADIFGRFGRRPAQITLGPPPRPAPPPPVLRYRLDLHNDDLASLPPAGPLSPGDLRLSVVVPAPPYTSPPTPPLDPADPRLTLAIAVPGLNSLAAGALPIKTLTVALDGDPHVVDVTSPGLTELAPLPLADLSPQESTSYTLTATFTDSAGTDSPTLPPVTFTVTDKRPLPAIPTGLGLLWTSAPGPGPDVQLRLAWPSPAGTLHRIYVIDQQGLELTDAELAVPVPGADPSRASVAAAGANKVLSGASIDRSRFRLLTDTATADSTGRAVLDTTLPRSLQTVKFLRITPLNEAGTEAPFDQCGIVPVAVPDSRRPPQPQLDGTVDPVTGIATFTVTADGFDGVALRRDEPGLFDPVAGAAAAPRLVIRRTVSAVQDPIYASQAAEGELAYDAAQAPRVVFANRTAQDTNNGRGLEPFVRYVYWAQVSLPPERCLPPGVTPIDGAVTAVDPANAADHPRPMSLPSAPRILMRTPPDPPAAPPAGNVQVTRTARTDGGTDLAIEITDPPTAHPKAIGPYRLAVWPQWPGQAVLPVINEDYSVEIGIGRPSGGASLTLITDTITVPVPPPDAPGAATDPITLRLAYVDPAGRLGELTTMTVIPRRPE